MTIHNYSIGTHDKLESIIDFELFQDCEHILVQVFCGNKMSFFSKTIKTIDAYLPQAIIVGSSTDGEIYNDVVSVRHCVVSVSTFTHTKLQSCYCNKTDYAQSGKDLANKLITEDTKLIILFADGTNTNAEDLLGGMQSVNNQVIIAGGLAGDNGKHQKTYVALGDKLHSKGVVAVSLSSKKLFVNTAYHFDWHPLGLEHTITKATKNRIYTIGSRSAVEFYERYLGKDLASSLPATAIEFPLMIMRNDILVARAAIAKSADGSILFAGNFKEGESVRLGFGNAEQIVKNTISEFKQISNMPTEAFFIYACMARRRYLNNLMGVELQPFAQNAPTSGFFTYAEFFHTNNSNVLLNQSLTVLSLSEKNNAKLRSKKVTTEYDIKDHSKTIQAFTHIIEQTQRDYRRQAKKLSVEKQYSQKILGMQEKFVRNVVHETNTLLSIITANVDLHEMDLGKNKYTSNIELAMKNMFNMYEDLSYLIKKSHIRYPKSYIELVEYVRSRKDFFRPLASQKDQQIILRSSVLECFVYFNEFKLGRIIDNTISNAIKYTYENTPILIDIKLKKTKIELSFGSHSIFIKDTQKIFDEYYREIGENDGFGLGLNLVKNICTEENIAIAVKSNQKYTKFKYKFLKQ